MAQEIQSKISNNDLEEIMQLAKNGKNVSDLFVICSNGVNLDFAQKEEVCKATEQGFGSYVVEYASEKISAKTMEKITEDLSKGEKSLLIRKLSKINCSIGEGIKKFVELNGEAPLQAVLSQDSIHEKTLDEMLNNFVNENGGIERILWERMTELQQAAKDISQYFQEAAEDYGFTIEIRTFEAVLNMWRNIDEIETTLNNGILIDKSIINDANTELENIKATLENFSAHVTCVEDARDVFSNIASSLDYEKRIIAPKLARDETFTENNIGTER